MRQAQAFSALMLRVVIGFALATIEAKELSGQTIELAT
jgi:hypothetical protein